MQITKLLMLSLANRYITSSRLHQKQTQKQHASLPGWQSSDTQNATTTKSSTLPSNKTNICDRDKALQVILQKVLHHSIPNHTTNTVLFCSVPQQASATCNNPTLHSSSTSRANEPRDPLKDTQQLSWLLRGVQRQSKATTRLPINPKMLQQLIESVLGKRHLSRYKWYLYATPISIAYFGCLRAGEVSYPSTHSFHPKQHLTIKDIIIHQNTVQLLLTSSKTDQFRRGATIIIGPSKQNICPVQITN